MRVGDEVTLSVKRMAHGGEGIAELDGDGRVFFVAGAFPGDVVKAKVTKVKKNFGRAELQSVEEKGPLRVDSYCPAAEAGAGCCDFDTLDPDKELDIKSEVLLGQLRRIGKLSDLPVPELIELTPRRGWRTRVRLGVDDKGRAGLRKRGSHELVTDQVCTQLAPGLVDGLVGASDDVRRFSPGAEVIAVIDAEGNRHVAQTRKAPRGKRVEKITDIIEGNKQVVERADGYEFRFPVAAFWQAHAGAPDRYAQLVREWLRPAEEEDGQAVGWDLYGGVGVFVPAIAQSLGANGAQAAVYSVDFSPAATVASQPSLEEFDVHVVSDKVEKVADQLPSPAAVVLDPPRTGAGAKVVATVAAAAPQQVIHVGCDPATFARDLQYWQESGFFPTNLAVINAFPGTHHVEAVALLERSNKA
ncbi:RNA methyltransferase [Corynebacterium phocae]|uniref:RNA methyltransferase n=1 Tax=Corynebacterium phocae TaxID=161895 RepID=A0A1L7D6J3_9CORY|nr:RNA methyltransferase [Corynebacterium phocae]